MSGLVWFLVGQATMATLIAFMLRREALAAPCCKDIDTDGLPLTNVCQVGCAKKKKPNVEKALPARMPPPPIYFEIEQTDADDMIRFKGHFSRRELAKLRLDSLDRAVIGAKVEHAEDHLQSLEILFRRYREQNA